jgi:predicted acylesterase/phospholipase RssA
LPALRPPPPPGSVDLVLSSGFLAFAHHAGFLQAVEDAGLSVGGVMGTSAGALTGALYAAGHSPAAVARELSAVPPIRYLRPAWPWRGVASLAGVVDRLRDLLPPTFEDLPTEFCVGVVAADGRHVLLDSGPLPEAVAASAAIPGLFAPLAIAGAPHPGPFRDGGVVDRTGLRAWRARRASQAASAARRGVSPSPPPPALVHVIHRSSALSGDDDVAGTGERWATCSRPHSRRPPRAGARRPRDGGATAASRRPYRPTIHRQGRALRAGGAPRQAGRAGGAVGLARRVGGWARGGGRRFGGLGRESER